VLKTFTAPGCADGSGGVGIVGEELDSERRLR
jgi:hypothetical protein